MLTVPPTATYELGLQSMEPGKGASLRAILDQFEQIASFSVAQWGQALVVQDQ